VNPFFGGSDATLWPLLASTIPIAQDDIMLARQAVRETPVASGGLRRGFRRGSNAGQSGRWETGSSQFRSKMDCTPATSVLPEPEFTGTTSDGVFAWHSGQSCRGRHAQMSGDGQNNSSRTRFSAGCRSVAGI
jgi:hypothetical protein